MLLLLSSWQPDVRSPDGGRLAASALGVWLWDLTKPGAAPVRLSQEKFTPSHLAFSRDGTRLAVSGSGSNLQVLDLRNPNSSPLPLGSPGWWVAVSLPLGNPGSWVAFSPDGGVWPRTPSAFTCMTSSLPMPRRWRSK